MKHFTIPVRQLRCVLEPPVPIGTVLPFVQLGYATSARELAASLDDLFSHLAARVGEEENRQEQLALFEPEIGMQRGGACLPAPVLCTGDLKTLVAQGLRFPTIYADPPWPYENRASRAAAANHYPSMSLDDICSEPVDELAEEDAHLHLWTTNAFLREAFDVIDAWGFRYKSCLVWIKNELGMGNYWRVSHEYLLFASRGSLPFRDNTCPSWIQASRSAHSRKPGLVRTLIERVSPGPYLELHGREELPGSLWTVYGNQIERRLF